LIGEVHVAIDRRQNAEYEADEHHHEPVNTADRRQIAISRRQRGSNDRLEIQHLMAALFIPSAVKNLNVKKSKMADSRHLWVIGTISQ